MTKPIFLTVNLPFFPGFYESRLSAAIDWEEEGHVENVARESDHETDESHLPEALHLDESDLASILFDVTDYRAAYLTLARDYVAALDLAAGEAFGMSVKATRQRYDWETKKSEPETYQRPSIRATFESMDSPREYNFTTDRVYAHIPLAVMRHILRQSKAEGHATLARVIADNFTSRDGFSSFYSNDAADWLAKPLQDWDHNELGHLLMAGLALAGLDPESDEFGYEVTDKVIEDEGPYQAWERAVDWNKYEAKRLEARAPKLLAWIEADPDAFAAFAEKSPDIVASIIAADPDEFDGLELPELPYRCPATPDLFDGRIGRH